MSRKYYGPQTELALQNFPFPIHQVHKELIFAIIEIKQAAALTHQENKELDEEICQAIVQASEEVLDSLGTRDTASTLYQQKDAPSAHNEIPSQSGNNNPSPLSREVSPKMAGGTLPLTRGPQEPATGVERRGLGGKDYEITTTTPCNDRFHDQFPLSAMQGGAGTSINMNVNEVLASRATEILQEKGIKENVHPNDHVNRSQSTNDVNPSALKIVTHRLLSQIVKKLDGLIQAFDAKAEEFKDIAKLGRTHIQDAVPTTLGAEMRAYSAVIRRDRDRFQDVFKFLDELNLGGTAIGNGINASPDYQKSVYQHLREITGLGLQPASNKMSQTSGQADFAHVSSLLTILAGDMSKISKDLRFLASGPNGGIGEITLENLQPGSSIMPGKVNPVIPEVIDQMFYFVTGKNMTIQKAAEDSHLELGIMFPVLADSLITSLKVVLTGIEIFTTKCIQTLQANPDKCQEHLEKSTAYATLLTPILGYDTVSQIVKESVASKRTVRELVLEKGLLSKEEFEKATKV